MKRARRLLAALVVAFVLLGGVGAAQTAVLEIPPENLIRNPSFADEAFWTLKGSQVRLAPALGRRGDGAVEMAPAQPYQEEVVQTIGPRLVPGRRYTATAWVRATTKDAIAVLGVRWEGGHPRVFRGLDPESGWTRIEFRFTAPRDEGWRQLVLSGAGGLIWDDVGLYEADTLEARLAAAWEELLASGEPIYTGLVVNAKGTALQRGMSPRIYAEDGRLVFAGVGAGDDQLYDRGLVAYATSLEDAITHGRLEVSEAYPIRLPLVVDAQGARGLPTTHVVIGNADAELIEQAVKAYDFLGRFAIVFVHEPFAGLENALKAWGIP